MTTDKSLSQNSDEANSTKTNPAPKTESVQRNYEPLSSISLNDPTKVSAIEKLRLPKGRVKLTSTDLGDLLQDVTFVDFFNVFLCQPIFPQRMFYKFTEKEFEFEPSLSKARFLIDRRKLVSWLVYKRLPYFTDTDLVQEFLLAKDLLTLSPCTTDSAHNLQYDHYRKVEDVHYVAECIGNVAGMCKFREYLTETPGEKVINCLMDLRKFHRIRKGDKKKRCIVFRELQVKYFKPDECNGRKKTLWSSISDGSNLMIPVDVAQNYSPEPVSTSSSQSSIDEILDNHDVCEAEIESKRLKELELLLLAVLKDYWLQKYILHCRTVQNKKAKSSEAPHKVTSKSGNDVALLKEVKNIDKALAVLQSTLLPGSRIRIMKATMNWRAMFPENTVDDSFLKNSEEIVTVHKDGSLSVDKMDSSKFEQMMQKYLEYSSSDEDVDEETEKEGKKCDLMTKLIQKSATRPKSRARRSASGDALLKRISKAEQAIIAAKATKSNLAMSEQILGLNFETIPQKKKQMVPSEDESKKDSTKPPVELAGVPKKKRPKSESRKRRPNLKVPQLKKKQMMEEEGMPDMNEIWKLDIQIEGGVDSSTRRREDGAPASALPAIQDGNQIIHINHADIIGPISTHKYHTQHMIEDPRFKYKNMCDGYYRYDNRDFVCSVISNHVAGNPFERYLRHMKEHAALTALHFLMDAQQYLSSKIYQSESVSAYIKFRRARTLIMNYLSTDVSKNLRFLPTGAAIMLQRLLPAGKGDDLIIDAQDLAFNFLRGDWKSFCKCDTSGFCAIMSYRHTTTINRRCSSEASFWPDKKRASTTVKLEELNMSDIIFEVSQMMEKTMMSDSNSEYNKRKLLALQLGLALYQTYDPALPIDPLYTDNLEFDYENIYGSLSLKKLVVTQRRDLIKEHEYQQRLEERARQKRLDDIEREKRTKRERLALLNSPDAIPIYKRPFKRAGKWFNRPPKPRNFQEILKDVTHLEFFRRYLAHNEAETPFSFYMAVEEMKKIKSNRTRQQKVNTILRKFFSSFAGKGVEALECNNDVVNEIPRLTHVQPAMLISAQACVAKSMEEKWFDAYNDTFDDSGSNHKIRETMKTIISKKIWGRDKTKQLWMTFVRKVVSFRRGLLNHDVFKLFNDFLREEVRIDCSKQRTSTGQPYVHGMPLKKVICNRLIDVTKLLNDVAFLAEAERYRIISDDAQVAASEGSYSTNNTGILEQKAKTMIMCYLDSDIPPKTQVNVSQDNAETVLDMFRNKVLERSLFHECSVALFPVLIYYWRKFQMARFSGYNPSNDSDDLNDQSATNSKSMTSTDGIPDYLNMQTIKFRRIVGHFDDDNPRILFSLLHGARFVVPCPRDFQAVRRDMSFKPQGSVLYNKSSSTILDVEGANQGRRTSIMPPTLEFGGRRTSIMPPTEPSAVSGGRRTSILPPTEPSVVPGGRRTSILPPTLLEGGGRRASMLPPAIPEGGGRRGSILTTHQNVEEGGGKHASSQSPEHGSGKQISIKPPTETRRRRTSLLPPISAGATLKEQPSNHNPKIPSLTAVPEQTKDHNTQGSNTQGSNTPRSNTPRSRRQSVQLTRQQSHHKNKEIPA